MMMFSLLAIIVIAVVVAVPVAIAVALRAMGGVTRSLGDVGADRSALDARLNRIEDAIDAMAQQIERMRTEDGPGVVPLAGERARRLRAPGDDFPDA